jgi:Alkylmercury lyase
VTIDDEDIRLAVYRAFATSGRAPSPRELAEEAGTDTTTVRAGLRRLAAARHLVLDENDEVVMAHPFASVPLGFSVMGARTLWWGGCAWDSFSLPHLLDDDPDVLVATRCPACDAALAWVVGRDAPPCGDEVAHFLVPVAHIWDDVVHTCAHQRLFCSPRCVDAWLRRAGRERGYVLDLATLWRLARGWYAGRLTRGYARRDPSTAADYFRQVGLEGPFWGLPA